MAGNAIYTNNDIKIVMACHVAEIGLPKIVKTEKRSDVIFIADRHQVAL